MTRPFVTKLSTWALYVFILASLSYNAIAQTSNVTCLASFTWSLNSLHQSPCLVAAYLESVCHPGTAFTTLPGLSDVHYLGPDFADADPCKCSTVTYSLVSACGACQNHTFESWGNWSINCPSTFLSNFTEPIPPSTQVPLWAYLDVTRNNTFDVVTAQSNATDIPASSTITKTTVTSSSSATTPPIPVSSEAPATSGSSSDNSTSKKSNAGAIAGGVVGGIAFLATVGLVAFWFFNRRSLAASLNVDQNGVLPEKMDYFNSRPVQGHGRTATSPSRSSTLYGTNTSPASPPPDSTIYTMYPAQRSIDHLTVSQTGTTRLPVGHYSGVAEL